jgi:hypothetical protein
MKTKNVIIMVTTALILISTQSLMAATAFGSSQSINVADSFRTAHPVLMVFFNIGGILLLVGVCASICSVFSKDPRDNK